MYLLSIVIFKLILICSVSIIQYTMPDQAEPEMCVQMDPVPTNFPKISVSILNCNSLNMASANKQTRIRKFYGIVKLKTDIIMLSDIRMCNKGGVSDLQFISSILAVNPYCAYRMYHQSRSNSRGVGILIKKSLNFSCTGEERDQAADNYLLLRATVCNTTVILGSIYGPNETNPNFFVNLKNAILRLGNHPCILGGDWNATYSCLPIASNIDVINMQALPNITNSKKIKEMCLELGLTDPYRALYPNKIEFSFAPWGNTRTNRSRLDYFVISNNIIPLVNECCIKPSVQSRLFDHKAVTLDFSAPKPVSTRPSITNKILRDPDTDKVVELASYDCYCTNIEGHDAVKNAAARLIGRGFELLKEAGPDPAFLPYAHATLRDMDERAQLMDQLDNIMVELRELQLDNLPMVIDDDIFMEILINGIKNAVISHQAFISKTVALSQKNLIKKLTNLKLDVKKNFDEISRLEIELRNINEIELNSELEKNPNFETLNSERITPYFVKMAKGSLQERSQNEIRNSDGRAFDTLQEQKEYIFKHFADSFKLNMNEPESFDNCIETFLGPEILAHPLIDSLKLNDEEKLKLEEDLSISELDAAIEGSNKNSAAGLDGLSTKFIQRYWNFFRKPLHKYAHTVFRKGTLTVSFRSSIIKLIPKKGDARDIKKWRPISLLGCLYKIISRAVNNRLKLVINRFTSRAQKGFTNHRYIQEVLINVAEKIAYRKT